MAERPRSTSTLAEVCSQPARLKILCALIGTSEGRGITGQEVALQAGIDTSTVYRHIGEFVDMHLIESVEDGENVRYRYIDPQFERHLQGADEALTGVLDGDRARTVALVDRFTN